MSDYEPVTEEEAREAAERCPSCAYMLEQYAIVDLYWFENKWRGGERCLNPTMEARVRLDEETYVEAERMDDEHG